MNVIFVPYIAPTVTIQLCTGPVDIWSQFLLPAPPWTEGRDYGEAQLSFNGNLLDHSDAIILDDCSIFVAGYNYWYRVAALGLFSNYSRVFSVSTDGGGTFSTLADFYPYQISDPDFFEVQLLLPCDGENQSTIFTDVSLSDRPMDRTGNVEISTSRSKWGGASAYFPGGGAWLYAPMGTGDFGTTDFTIEGWFSWSSLINGGLFHVYPGTPAGATSGLALGYDGTNFQIYTGNNTYARAYTPVVDTWYHIALVRSSGLLQLYVDGIAQGAAITDGVDYGGNGINLGLYYGTTTTFLGYVDDFRVTANTARYTGDYTVPSAPLVRPKFGEYDPLLFTHSVNGMALAENGNTVYVLHNTSDYDGQYDFSNVTGLKNYLITSKTTDLGNTWSHEISNINQIATTAAIYTPTGLFHVGSDIKTYIENSETASNLYISVSADHGASWDSYLAMENTQAQPVAYEGYATLPTSIAEVQGNCGVLFNGFDTVTGNSVIYFLKPTSVSTWDTRVLYDRNGADFTYHSNHDDYTYARVKLLPLQSAPGTILAFYCDYGSSIHLFRSTDSGNTWSEPSQVYPITAFDQITPDVTLSRVSYGTLINTQVEAWPSWMNNSPQGTEWNSQGWDNLSNVSTRVYDTFYNITGLSANTILSQDLVMHTVSSNRYFRFKFTDWGTSELGGSFAYTRQEIDSAGANINSLVTVIKPETEAISDFDNIGWGPNYDAVELANGRVVVVLCAWVPPDLGFNALKYVISTDAGLTFTQHGWGTNASAYGENFSDKYDNYGYRALASGNDVVLVGSTYDQNNVIRITPLAGTEPPPMPPVPVTMPFEFIWSSPEYASTLTISVTGNTNVEVNWGDGTVTQYLYTGPQTLSHTYGSAGGVFTVSVMGQTESLKVGSWTGLDRLTEVTSFGNLVNLTSLVECFVDAVNLANVPETLPGSVSNIAGMFSGCTSLNDANISYWNTANVINMSQLFKNIAIFNQPLGSWNTSNVTDMSWMFGISGASGSFDQDISGWDTGNVTNTTCMFYSQASFNQNLNSWNMSKVTNMDTMFNNATAFNQDLNSWNTSNTTIMNNMFGGAIMFNGNISNWNTSNVTITASMFYGAQNFNQNIGSWDISNVTNTQAMFTSAWSFNQDISGWNTANVTDMSQMFWAANTFNQDLSSWCVTNIASEPSDFSTGATAWTLPKPVWGTCPGTVPNSPTLILEFDPTYNSTAGINFGYNTLVQVDWGDGQIDTYDYLGTATHSYGGNTSVKTITVMGRTSEVSFPSPNRIGYKKVISWGSLIDCTRIYLEGCTNLTSVPDVAPTTTDYHRIFRNCSSFNDANVAYWDTGNVTSMIRAFEGTSSFNANIASWNTSNVTDMSWMFYGSILFNQNIGAWNTGNVVNMFNMFSAARVFNQDISNWNTSNVTNMSGMFSGAWAFNKNLGSWDTGNVNTMSQMFNFATVFNGNVTTWNTANVTNMSSMFLGAENFNQNISAWNTGNVTTMATMFSSATYFNQPIGAWNTSNVTTMSAMFASSLFNQDISNWDTGNVTIMTNMFNTASSFNQDLSGWCVTNIASKPSGFDDNASSWALPKPVWGTCP